MTDIEEVIENINKKIKEAINKIKTRIIEQEYEARKNNDIILKELKELQLKYDIKYKIITLV